MDRAGFRDYVFPLDHPRVARLQGKDAHAHAQIARGDPPAQELLIEPWSRLITEPFTGITTDGTPMGGLFDLVPDGAPVAYLGGLTAAPAILGEWSFNFTLFGEPSDREPWGCRPGA